MARTLEEWYDDCMESGTSGDMVFDIIRDGKVQLAAEQARVEVLSEFLTRSFYGETESSVIEALRYYAECVRAHSGYDPGEFYNILAQDIQRALEGEE